MTAGSMAPQRMVVFSLLDKCQPDRKRAGGGKEFYTVVPKGVIVHSLYLGPVAWS